MRNDFILGRSLERTNILNKDIKSFYLEMYNLTRRPRIEEIWSEAMVEEYTKDKPEPGVYKNPYYIYYLDYESKMKEKLNSLNRILNSKEFNKPTPLLEHVLESVIVNENLLSKRKKLYSRPEYSPKNYKSCLGAFIYGVSKGA